MNDDLIDQDDDGQIVACTISRDIQNFDLLIEDMGDILGERWGDLGLNEAFVFFDQPEAAALDFVALAIDEVDEDDLDLISRIITTARSKDIKVILIAEEVSPGALHQLLREGANEFVPYPLPEGELNAAIERLKVAAEEEAAGPAYAAAPGKKLGVLLATHGLSGGVGASTLAVNLAYELATVEKKGKQPSVCLIDMDLQFGSTATYLDLPTRDVVYELWSDTESSDEEVFKAALTDYEEKMWVLTAPPDMLPLDMITPDDVRRVIGMARANFDYVIVDMPSTMVQWTETILHEAQVYFAVFELDMRSAQNTLRVKRALASEDLPVEKLRYCLNRAPKFTDLNGKARVKRMAEGLEVGIELMLPDGGRQIAQVGDQGQALGIGASKNPLRKEISKLAESLHALGKDDAEAA